MWELAHRVNFVKVSRHILEDEAFVLVNDIEYGHLGTDDFWKSGKNIFKANKDSFSGPGSPRIEQMPSLHSHLLGPLYFDFRVPSMECGGKRIFVLFVLFLTVLIVESAFHFKANDTAWEGGGDGLWFWPSGVRTLYILDEMPLSNCTAESVVFAASPFSGCWSWPLWHVCALRPAGQPGLSFSSASPSLIVAATVVSFQYFSSNSSKMIPGICLLLALRCMIVLESAIQ